MQKANHTFFVNNIQEFKTKMLNWVNQFNIFCLLDNNNYQFGTPAFDLMLAVGVKDQIILDSSIDFNALKNFSVQHNDWLFGHFNYPSKKKDEFDFPPAYFFIPEIRIVQKGNSIEIFSTTTDPQEIFRAIDSTTTEINENNTSIIDTQAAISKKEYLEKIESLQQHIQLGDCYEINFCQNFYATEVNIDPVSFYHQLQKISPNPFAAFYKLNEKYCICSSPERFIRKNGSTIISQPIKGTSKRVTHDKSKDEESKNYLMESTKEKSENVMIVDLVRNDFGKICSEGSVQVKELFQIYSFPNVHQMISTIEGQVSTEIHWTEIVDACFPMGSMTGAPKKKVMELIDHYENMPRGIFSGSIGYVTPEQDFDFNVVIRSLFYNKPQKYLSFKAGGGITSQSNPELEYQESLIKVNALKKILEG